MVRRVYVLLLTLLSSLCLFAAKLPTVPYKAPDLPSDPGEELPLGALWLLLIFILVYTGYKVFHLIKVNK